MAHHGHSSAWPTATSARPPWWPWPGGTWRNLDAAVVHVKCLDGHGETYQWNPMDWFTGKMVLAFTQLHIMLLYTYMHIGLCVHYILYIYIVYACPSSILILDRAGGSLKATLSLQFTVCRSGCCFDIYWSHILPVIPVMVDIPNSPGRWCHLHLAHFAWRRTWRPLGLRTGGWKPPGWTWNRSILEPYSQTSPIEDGLE